MKKLTLDELSWLNERDLYIVRVWISPMEKSDYELYYMGNDYAIFTAKSARACLSYARKTRNYVYKKKMTITVTDATDVTPLLAQFL